MFCHLPLAHVLNSRIFVVHGGLFGTDGVKLEDIRKVDRVREPPDEGTPSMGDARGGRHGRQLRWRVVQA